MKDDGLTTAVPGQDTVTYTIVVANAGPSDDPSVGVTDTFPAALSCTWASVPAGGASSTAGPVAGDVADTISLPAGSSVNYTVLCSIDPSATGTLSNTATAASSVTDPNGSNNSATDSDTVLMPMADLSITKTGSPASLQPGQPLTYTVTVNNTGPSDAPGVVVTDTLPAGVTFGSTAGGCAEDPNGVPACSLGTIAAGGSAQYTINVTVDAGTTGTITNNASVTAATPDPVTGNNSTTEDTSVNSPPVANAGGPYLVPEGTDSVVLSGLASFDLDQSSTSLLYEWDLDNDGSFDDATGFAPTLSGLAGYDGPTTLPIAVRVTDVLGETDEASGTVMIVNVDPTAIIIPTPVPPPAGPRRGTTPPPPAGEVSFLLMIFDFLDGTHTATVDWGDGTASEALTVDQIADTAPMSHTYAASGMFTIIVTVMDLDGATGMAVKTVTINVGDAGGGGGGGAPPRRSR